jgi:replication factor C subunit 1
LKAIEKHRLKTLDEDQFLDLIRTRKGSGEANGKVDPKLKKKMEKEEEAIKQGAKELELIEKKAGKQKEKPTGGFVFFFFLSAF